MKILKDFMKVIGLLLASLFTAGFGYVLFVATNCLAVLLLCALMGGLLFILMTPIVLDL